MKMLVILVLSCVLLVNAADESLLGSVLDGPCPDVPPSKIEIPRKDHEVWYTIYTNYEILKPVRCATANGTKINDTRTHYDSVMLNSTGHRIEFQSDLDKVAPGLYISTFTKDGENHQCNIVSVEDEQGVMAWGCKELDNGKHVESASIYSNQRSVSDELYEKFKNHLKDHGSHGIEMYKIDQENCPEQL